MFIWLVFKFFPISYISFAVFTVFMGVELVIMDYDGTLVDSEPVRQRFFHELCTKNNKPDPAEVIKKTYNTDAGFEVYSRMGFNLEEDLLYIWGEFIKFFNENPAPIFPYVRETISRIKKLNKKLALASANSIRIISPSLQRNGLEPAFDIIVTTEDSERKATILKKCADKLGVKNYRNVISVGDTQDDITGAGSLGMIAIAVGYGGFCSADLLKKHSPSELVLKPAGLLHAIEKYL